MSVKHKFNIFEQKCRIFICFHETDPDPADQNEMDQDPKRWQIT